MDTILIYGKNARVLFDIGASHSFIFAGYVHIYRIAIHSTIVGKSLVTQRVYKSRSLRIGPLTFLLNWLFFE